jgi:beta-N-acetylhexosaminidase
MKLFFSLCVWTSYCFGSDLLEEMSLREKVGQVLMVHFHGEETNENAKTLIQQIGVGAIIYYNWSNGLHSPKQVTDLSLGLQTLAKECRLCIPLLIAADQEGGVVTRLQTGFTSFPGNRALGETGSPALAKDAAFAMGQELHAVGINMNLAPVVDVNSNPKNPVIGVRSFGDDPHLVAAFGKEALQGFKQAGIIATLKHFPGYGDVAVDPHEDLPIIHKSKKALEAVELLPFAKLCPFADAVMTAHILVPALDPDHCSTLSEKTLQYLREVIGFQGVIVADSLVMDGVLKKCHSVEEASIMALNAGCDLLILGGKLLIGEHTGLELTSSDVQRVHSALVNAVQSGRIPEAKLNASVARILKLKGQYCQENSPTEIAAPEHQVLAQKIASLALRKVEHKPYSLAHLNKKNICIVAPDILQTALEHTSLSKLGLSTEVFFFHGLNPSDEESQAAVRAAMGADAIVVCSYNAWKNPAAADLTEALLGLGKPLILLAVRDPLDALLFPSADLIFTSFSPAVPSLQAICEELETRR